MNWALLAIVAVTCVLVFRCGILLTHALFMSRRLNLGWLALIWTSVGLFLWLQWFILEMAVIE